MVSPLARRSIVKYLTKTGKCSERRACVVVGLSRSLVRYIARWSKDETMLIKEIHKLAIRHSRYGYRRIAVLLRREGCKINRKRVDRIWKAEGLSLPLRRPRRRRVHPVGEIVNKAECLNREVFRNGRQAQAIVENWRQEYNNYRPHSSLDYLTPA